MNDKADYPLLAAVMERALRFHKLNRNAFIVLEVTLDHSYRIGLPSARFESREALLLLSTLKDNRLTEALNHLVTSRICIQEGNSKGPFTLKPVPNWYDWALPAASPRYADREYVASLVGYYVVERKGIWVAEPVPRVHPIVRRALDYAHGKFAPISPDETSVTQEDAVRGTAPPAKRRGRPPREVPPEQIAAENEARAAAARATSEEVQDYAERLFPGWEARRREPYIEKLVSDWGNAVVFRALQRARESRKPITRPWGFLKVLCRDLGKPKPPPST